jgi:hypothetical protein
MADQFGAVVLDDRLDHAGDFQLMGSTALIRVNRADPEERRRFTLAHELTHWLHAADPVGMEAVTETRAAGWSEEYLADKTAGAMLLPREWLKSYYAGSPQTLQTLGELARSCQVSLSAALVRMRDVERWRKSLFHWERERGEWILAGEAGFLPSQRGIVGSTQSTWCDLDRLLDTDWGTYTAPLRLRCGETEMHFDAEVRVGSGRVLALLELPSPRSPGVAASSYHQGGRGTVRVTAYASGARKVTASARRYRSAAESSLRRR